MGDPRRRWALSLKDPLMAAKRELQEETGAEAAHWELFLKMHLSNSVTDEEAIVYLATEIMEGESSPEDSEDLTSKWVSLDEALTMISSNEITDAITVATLYRYAYQHSST